MSAIERLRQLPGRAEQKKRLLDRAVLFSGFILQSDSPHEAFWLPELHRKTKTVARMTFGPSAIIQSVHRLQEADRIARIPQPEPAPDCWHSAEAGGPRRLTIPGIQDVVAAYCENSLGELDPVIAAMPDAIAERFAAHVDSASARMAKLSPSRLDSEQ